MTRAATHSGGFHADDVFALAVLRIVHPDLEIVRTRDPEVLAAADYRVDVGGRDDAASYETMKERLKVSIERYFRPEFLNRLDDVIVFHGLNRENLKQIVDIELSKVRNRLRDRGLELVLSDDAKEYLISKGYNPDYGARPLRRAIENMVEDPLSESILRGEFKGFDTLTVTLGETADGKKLKFDPSLKAGEAVAVGGSAEAGESK